VRRRGEEERRGEERRGEERRGEGIERLIYKILTSGGREEGNGEQREKKIRLISLNGTKFN
jgi:hypothetical protein